MDSSQADEGWANFKEDFKFSSTIDENDPFFTDPVTEPSNEENKEKSYSISFADAIFAPTGESSMEEEETEKPSDPEISKPELSEPVVAETSEPVVSQPSEPAALSKSSESSNKTTVDE